MCDGLCICLGLCICVRACIHLCGLVSVWGLVDLCGCTKCEKNARSGIECCIQLKALKADTKKVRKT